jgi:hypothetical protein
VSHPRIIVEVSPSRLALTVLRRAQVIASRSRRLDPPATDAPLWPANLHALTPTLRAWVDELHLKGRLATLLASPPSATCCLLPCPFAAGAAGALAAARLAAAETVAQSPGSVSAGAPIIAVETIASDAHGDARQRHTLALADTPTSVAAAANFIEAAGLEPEGLITHDALAAALMAHAALAGAGLDAPRAALWFGEHSSLLAVATPGRLRFVRFISVGTEPMVEALARRAADPTLPASLPPLTREDVRALFTSRGLPSPDRPWPALPAAPAALAPILQRLAIEIKQSLRFGLADAPASAPAAQPSPGTPAVHIVIDGPGGALPGLPEALARLCGTTVAAAGTESVAITLGEPGEGAATHSPLAALGDLELALLPHDRENAALVRRVRVGLWSGIAAACALVGVYAGAARVALAQERDRLAAVERLATADAPSTALLAEAADAQRLSTLLTERYTQRVAPQLPIDALLADIADATPNAIRLASVSVTASPGGSLVCEISGNARADSAANDRPDFSTDIRAFASRLEAIPIVSAVRLGTTQRTRDARGDLHQFELSLTLAPAPPADPRADQPAPGTDR